jgi:hypothetical protein
MIAYTRGDRIPEALRDRHPKSQLNAEIFRG